jgi:DNA polymerase III subunit alpha
MSDQFVSLHNHCSQGSMLDALQSYKQLIDRAKAIGQASVALTDHGAVNAIFEAYKYAKTQNIKLIVGNEFYFRNDLNDEDERGNKHLVLIASNAIGWSNILRLNFRGWQQQRTIFMKQYPVITWPDLENNGCEGIIALTACSSGILARDIMNNDEEKTHCHVKQLHHIFGSDNLFLEIQPHALKTENGKVDQVRVNNTLIGLAREYGIKLVATCDAHYLKGDHTYHDMMLAIKDKKPISDTSRHRYLVNDFYLKNGSAVMDFFGPELGVELIKNTQLINQRCEVATYLEPKGPLLPSFPVKDVDDYDEFKTWKQKNIKKDLPDDVCYLRYKTAIGFNKLYEHLEPEQVDEYYQRLKKELNVVEGRGFSSYMLMVADYVNWAKKHNIRVGKGRGSGAGSLTALLVGITGVDPLKHNLLFERFINKDKKALPDFDIDFSMPDKVKEYMKNKYGDKRVALLSNIMRMKPKVVVKDVARSLELGSIVEDEPEKRKSISFHLANDITKTMPDVKTIEEAMATSKQFSEFMLKYPELLSNCKRLQNIERQSGVHAAALIVSNEDLDGIAPLRCDKEGELVLAYDKDVAEEAGFVKFDFLGLITLSVMDEALKTIKRRYDKDIDIDNIEDGDPGVYKMISSGDTKCVFQLEASLTPLCQAIKPKNIEDLAVITTIGRPGVPLEDRQEYINRRFGRKNVELLHPKMANSTKDTFGILVYEEQLMFLAQDIAGWNFNKSDSLRKITKLKDKGKELQEKTGKEFIADAIKNDVETDKANKIWDRVVQFGGYSFNKAHAVSYSYISYQTAWLKHHYPTEYMCAIINSEDPNGDKSQEYQQLAKDMDIDILPPDINTSQLRYEVIGDNKIATGLFAVKGVGEAAIEYIMAKCPYASFAEFILKSTGTKGNRSPITKIVIESLAKAGCFDNLGVSRKVAIENWADVKEKTSAAQKKALKNNTEIDLTNAMNGIIIEEYNKKIILQHEMEVLGHYVSGTHNDIYGGFFKGGPSIIELSNINDIEAGSFVKVEAVIKLKSKEIKIKKKGKNFGRAFAKYVIEDVKGNTGELTLWPDHYEKLRKYLIDGIPFKAICEINEYMENKNLILKQIEDIPGRIVAGRFIDKNV